MINLDTAGDGLTHVADSLPVHVPLARTSDRSCRSRISRVRVNPHKPEQVDFETVPEVVKGIILLSERCWYFISFKYTVRRVILKLSYISLGSPGNLHA